MESFEDFKAEFSTYDREQIIKSFYKEKARLLETLMKRNDELVANNIYYQNKAKEIEEELNTVVEENKKIKKHIANLKDAVNFLSAEIE